jgi:hypothetical protein
LNTCGPVANPNHFTYIDNPAINGDPNAIGLCYRRLSVSRAMGRIPMGIQIGI